MKRINLTLRQAKELRLNGKVQLNFTVRQKCKVLVAEPLILESDEVEETKCGGVRVVAIYARQPARTILNPEELDETRIPINRASGVHIAVWLSKNDYVDRTTELSASRVPAALITLEGELLPTPGGSLLKLTSERTDSDSDFSLEVRPELEDARRSLTAALWRIKNGQGHLSRTSLTSVINELQRQVGELESLLR